MSNPVQFNFELPEEEANRLLDVGVIRKMGLSRITVQKAMIARALVLERLDEIAPCAVASPDQDAELIAKIAAACRAKPALKPALEKFLRDSLRPRRAAAAA